MYFDEITQAVTPMFDKLTPLSSGVWTISKPVQYLASAVTTLVTSVISAHTNRTSNAVPTQASSDRGASNNIFRVTRAEDDTILEWEECTIIGPLRKELVDYLQRFDRANLS